VADERKPAILYAAKSTEDKHGSIPTQLKDGRAFAEREGFKVVAKYEDEKASAYKGDRGPGLAEALAHAARIGAALIVQHSDRLARGDGKQARHLAELFFASSRKGITLRSVQDDSTFDSPILVAVMGERNMEDSRRKSQAVKAGLDRRRKRGLPLGGPPSFGYRYERNELDERLRVIEPIQAEVVRRIVAWHLAGKGYMAIAQELRKDGSPSPKGGPWNSSRVCSVLSNPFIAGLIRDGEGFIEGRHEPIIDRQTWEQLEALRKARARTYKRGRNPLGKHLFRKGFLRCGKCGATMVPRSERLPHDGLSEAYYCFERFKDKDNCNMPRIPRAKVDDAIYAYFQGLDLDIEATRKQMASATARKLAEARELLHQAQQEEQESEARLKRVKRDYFNGDLTAEEWRELREELEPEFEAAKAETQSLRARLREAEDGTALAEFQAGVLEAFSEVREALTKEIRDAGGAAELRAVLMRLFEGFVLHREGPKQGEVLALANGGSWIEPLVIEEVLGGYSEGLRPSFSHCGAQNNPALP
jgi:site-specific DNA recombinase